MKHVHPVYLLTVPVLALSCVGALVMINIVDTYPDMGIWLIDTGPDVYEK